ncbi:hypothetical protein [Sulfurimonas sp.]|uniref:hypothetical protein n=1 Tax=Sulfurimonas sp. TaxID=2022749 RepID=UPI0025F7B312|nr:hypothetical protein [Sulfurimonas sp.]
MKHTQILFLLFINYYLTCFGYDFLPDDSVIANNLSEFNTSTTPNASDSTTFTKYDSNTSIESLSISTAIEQITDEFGNSESDSNVSSFSVQDLKGFSDSNKGKYATKGSALFQTLGESFGGVNTGNMETLTREYILAEDVNSSESRAIQFNEDFYAKARSLIANLKTISCYATRKLVNSYYCPLPGMEDSFFKGGDAKDSKENAKEACEDLCDIPVSCLHKEMNKDIETVTETTLELIDDSVSLEIEADEGMLGEFIEFSIENKYQYDDNITLDSDEYNATKALEILQDSNHGVKIDVSYMDSNSSYRKLLTSYDCKLNELTNDYKIFLTGIRTSKIKIDFYKPYNFINKAAMVQEDEKLKSNLIKVKLKYSGNEWWFCPEIHFVSSSASCSGEIESVSIGSQVYSVCVTEARQRQEPQYGAFYSEASCQSACRSVEDCVPTYKHLTNIDPYNLPASLNDIEVGCVDEATNTSCTDALCMEKFIADDMPYLEKSWINDDTVKITVSSGIVSQDTVRPRIDIEGGISANDNEQLREESSIREMSEISYMNMLNSDTYDISQNKVSTNIPMRNSYDILSNGSGEGSLVWNLKPNSHDIGNGNDYYFYSLFDISSNYIPNAPNLADINGTINPRLDRTIMLKTESGYKIIKKIENAAIQLTSDDGTLKWFVTPTSIVEKFETFNGIGFSSFDENSNAESFASYQFTGDKNYETFILYDSLEVLVETPGVLFLNQTSQGNGRFFTRIYDGTASDTYSSYLNGIVAYGIYSKEQLSYKNLVDVTIGTIDSLYAVYSTKYSLPKGEIASDGTYNTEKVQMFIGGSPNNMNVNVTLTPNSNEEGKKTFIYMLLYDENSTEGSD